jgi:hypothetical protein
VRELVMVLTDVYLPTEEPHAPRVGGGRLAGLEYTGRFGSRTVLRRGWRDWLARYLGREDLAALAPARIAAAVLGPGVGSDWIATPVHLSAALTRVHLDHRGLLRLKPEELAELALSFGRTFAGSGLTLYPLPCGEFLLRAAGIAVTDSIEPARVAGGEVVPLRSAGSEGAALRRAASEIEMWLHAHSGGASGAPAGQPRVNALWLWGARGAEGEAARRRAPEPVAGFGSEAYLDGLWHLEGAQCSPVPQDLQAVLGAGARRTVLALSVAAQLEESMSATFSEALAMLDARFIAPALAALGGTLASVTLIANDTALRVRRGSGLKRWRRARPALAGFA